MTGIVKKSFDAPEETTEFPKAKIDVVTVSGVEVRRLTCEPGWIWAKSVGSEMGKESCPLDHAIWIITSGRFAVKMDDGTTEEYGLGDVGAIPAGHDAWVVGDEPVVGIDFLADSLDRTSA